MKIILKIAVLVILLPIQLYARLPDDIKHAIKKSKLNLLTKALDGQILRDEHKKECLKLANKILNIRENKMKANMINPKKLHTPGTTSRIGAICVGFWMAFALINCTIFMSESDEALGILGVGLAIEALLALLAKKLWVQGEKLDIQFFEKYRSLKQKYLDASEINEILSKL